MKCIKYFIISTLLSTPLHLSAQAITCQPPPLPNTTSKEIQSLIAKGSIPWDIHPKTAQQWKIWISEQAQIAKQQITELRKQFEGTIEPEKIAGVNVFTITPKQISTNNKNRLLLNFHGGGYVLNPGEAGIAEALMMASNGHIKVITVDYRMAPDFPYPAALDDALAVYRELIKTHPSENMGVFGSSTGGGMTLSLMLRLKSERLPLPAAMATGTPWSDMTKTGDSYFTNEGIDNVLVSYDGWLGEAAKLYANGHDLRDPLLSPIYGNVEGLPPTLLVTGTRDLFLSNTVRMDWKLREANVPTELIVFEGLSHFQYLMSTNAPETKLYFLALSNFFDHYLAK